MANKFEKYTNLNYNNIYKLIIFMVGTLNSYKIYNIICKQ